MRHESWTLKGLRSRESQQALLPQSPRAGQGGGREPPLCFVSAALDSDGGRELDCQLCGAWFETRKGLSSHARAHLRHLGVSDPDAKGSPIDVLHGLIRRDGVQIRLPPGRGALAQLGRPSPASAALSLLPPQPPAKKAKLKAAGTASPWGKQDLSAATAAGIFWASDVEPSPLNLCRFSLQPPLLPAGPGAPPRGRGLRPLPTPSLLGQGVDRGPWQWAGSAQRSC